MRKAVQTVDVYFINLDSIEILLQTNIGKWAQFHL